MLVDSTTFKAYPQAAGQKKAGSHDGLTTKGHGAVQALGQPVYMRLAAEPEADCQYFDRMADALPLGVPAVVSNPDYDTDMVLTRIAHTVAQVVVWAKKRLQGREIDDNLYEKRNMKERFCLHRKQNRAVATRYDKTAASPLGVMELVCIMCWLWLKGQASTRSG